MDFSNVAYRIKKGLHQRKASKSYTCEKCGCEIPKGDLYFEYKPLPTKTYWSIWRKRCMDCKPHHYDEAQFYQNIDLTNYYPIKEVEENGKQ